MPAASTSTEMHMEMPYADTPQFEIRDEIPDVEQHKAVVTFSSTAETTVGLASFQGVLVMRFTEDGTKIAEMEEFTDSVAMLELMGKMQAAHGEEEVDGREAE